VNLVGKKVRISDPSRLKLFYPNHKIVRELPVMDSSYIYVGGLRPDFDRYSDMIWVTYGAVDVDLENKEVVLELAKFSSQEREYLLSCDEAVCWEAVRNKVVFGISPVIEKEESVFKLFLALTKSDKEIYQVYSSIDLPQPVILSSLLTMIEKAINYQQYRGLVNVNYLRTLENTGRVLKNVKDKLVKFYLSDRDEIQFINLLMGLKR